MKKTALALASALLLLAACDSSSSDNGANGGAGSNGYGANGGILGHTADGTSVGDRVFFATDSSVVTGEGQSTLANQASWLKSNGNVNIVVEGHADERGTREYNIALGERRATDRRAVAKAQRCERGIEARGDRGVRIRIDDQDVRTYHGRPLSMIAPR